MKDYKIYKYSRLIKKYCHVGTYALLLDPQALVDE